MTRSAYAAAIAVALAWTLFANAQTIGLTLQQQTEDTKIANVTCNELEGFFTVTIYNGFVEDRTFYLTGQSDGVGEPLNPTPLQLTILGRTSGNLFLYGPSTGAQGSRSIVGVRSQITAWMVDYASNNPAAIVGEVTRVCGDSYASPCHCSFFNVFCWIDDCSPERSAFFWMFIDFIVAAGVSLIGALGLVNHGAFFSAIVSHFVTNVGNVPTDEEQEEKRVLHDMHQKKMSLDDLEREAAELEADVGSPASGQIMYREAMHHPPPPSAGRFDGAQEGSFYRLYVRTTAC